MIVYTSKLVDAKLTTGDGTAVGPLVRLRKTVQGTVSGTGAVSATIPIRVSNDNVAFILAGTITLSGTTDATDGFVIDGPWAFIRADVDAIAGTGAAVTVTISE